MSIDLSQRNNSESSRREQKFSKFKNISDFPKKQRPSPKKGKKEQALNNSETGKLFQINTQTQIIETKIIDEVVPVYKIVKNKNTITLVEPKQEKPKIKADRNNSSKDGEKSKEVGQKEKTIVHTSVIARGTLHGTNNIEADLSQEMDFQGNFSGAFETEQNPKSPILCYYFEGEITDLKILKIYKNSKKDLSSNDLKDLAELSNFKGYFKGLFIRKYYLNYSSSKDFNSQLQRTLQEEILKTKTSKTEYHVPARVRMDLRKISEINLEKSSAQIAAILGIDVQLHDEVLQKIYYDKKTETFTKKCKLTIDCHRGKPYVLPFYDPGHFEDTDEEDQYEWDDVWEGIDLEVEWKPQQKRMSYQIRTIYTAEIDNSHGIFLAPFNLNILKIIIDFHSIKVDKDTKICINCCDLTDYSSSSEISYNQISYNQISYNPYIYFDQLPRNQQDKSKSSPEIVYSRHIDRMTKIDTTNFVDQGEYKIANNRLALFPYHKRVFKNKNAITSDLSWTLGKTDRKDMLTSPQVSSVKESFQNYMKSEQLDFFGVEQWEFVHVEIPIFKYPVIDIIRIFVPIMILSVISMMIFAQENAVDYNNFTELAKRIASGCSLLIAYVALIPMIRSNLPPTPSVTLIEILIYLSTIPNFLAIISSLITQNMGVDQFFATYKPFTDGLFLVSFAIVCMSIIILIIVMVVYAKKDYKSDFTFYKFRLSPMSNLRAPVFTSYIYSIENLRKEYEISADLQTMTISKKKRMTSDPNCSLPLN